MAAHKPRPPHTPAEGVTRIIAEIGADGCAAAIGRSEGLVHRLANPDDDTARLGFEQAAQLDAAYLAVRPEVAVPPLLETYRHLLQASGAGAVAAAAARADLRDRALTIGVEFGELQADTLDAHRDGQLTPLEVARLVKDARDLRDKVDAYIATLACGRA
jgi:hypothetical protein